MIDVTHWPFNVVVGGRQIARVVFALDGRVVRSLTRPNTARRYALLIKPTTLRIGRHRVLASQLPRAERHASEDPARRLQPLRTRGLIGHVRGLYSTTTVGTTSESPS